MGQAKQRGTYAERRAAAISLREQERILKKKREQKQIAKISTISLMAVALGTAASHLWKHI